MDPQTLYLVNIALPLVVSLILLSYRRWQVAWPGFAFWTAGTAGLAAGYAVMYYRPSLTVVAAVSLTHASFLAMTLLRLEGICRFLGKRSILRIGLVTTATELLLVLFFTVVADVIVARTILFNGLLTFGCLYSGWMLITHRAPGSRLPYRTLGALQAAYPVALVFNAVYSIATGTIGVASVGVPYLFAFFILEVATGAAFLMVQGKRAEEKTSEAEAELRATVADLEQALAEIRTLSGLVPICASCKKIRDDEGYWNEVEIYIRRHTQADFTHGICPECVSRLYPGIIPEDEEE